MPKDWNDIDQSEQQSDDHEVKQQTQQTKKEEQNKNKNQNSLTKINDQPNNKQTIRQKPKFLSDQQLIQKIRTKQLQQRKKIKIVRCFSEQLIQTIKNHKLVSYCKQIKLGQKPAFYILSFRQQQDLISFIQQKISNKYRFYLHPYIKTQKDIQRQKQRQQKKYDKYNKKSDDNNYYNKSKRQDDSYYNNKRQNDAYYKNKKQDDSYYNNKKQDKYKQKQDRYKDKGHRQDRYSGKQQRYKQKQHKQDKYKDKKQQYQPKTNKQDDKRTNRNRPQYNYDEQIKPQAIKVQQKPKQNKYLNKQTKTQQKLQFNFQFNDNTITIKQNAYSKTRIVDQIVKRKLASKFNKIKILVHHDGLDKAIQLVQLIYDAVQYGMKVLPDQKTKSQFIQIVLQLNCHMLHPNAEYRLLGSNPKRYFQEIKTKNKFRISKDFNVDQYVKGFIDNQKQLCKKWNQMTIKAEAENIPNLLKLSCRLKKQLYLSINIKVGERNQIPWSILLINPETDKDKRPKVDASFVNSYLTN